MQKFPTWLSSRHKQLTRIRDGQPLHHEGLFSNWNSTWIIIQIRDDRVSSSVRNIMEHYPCRHSKKHFLPWLWPIRLSSSLVLDQESLELCTLVWNLPTYLTYPTRPTCIMGPISYGKINSQLVHAHKIEESEPMPIIPPNSHPLQHLQLACHLLLKKVLLWPTRWISSSHPLMACSRLPSTKIMATVA